MDYDLSFLDDMLSEFNANPEQAPAVHTLLVNRLYNLRHHSRHNGWSELRTKVIDHPIREVLHQDPFTFRSFTKPRGYPGDAVMLDYMYCHDAPENTSDLGQRLFQHCVENHNPCKAVRHRKNLLAQTIDTLGQHSRNLRILSVGCGHLREAAESQVVKSGNYGEYIALDHDLDCLAEVEQSFNKRKTRIVTLDGSVTELIRKQVFHPSARFDFIYAAGLYDYLPQVVAQKLTRVLFELLDNGGQLLVSNAIPDFPETGYSETFMDWPLIYRNEAELVNVAALITPQEVASICLSGDPFGVYSYLQLTRN